MTTPTPSPFTDIQCGGLHLNATTLTSTTSTATPFIPQTCLVLAPNTLPSYAISVAVTHFVTGGLALLCAVGFVANVATAKKVMLAMGSKQPTDKISFFVAPLLCCIFCFCSTVHGLSTFPNVWSTTYNINHGIGCECLASVTVQNVRYALHSFVVPLILIVAFEQSYVIHKRKTAKFCCIGFDRGHRLKAKTNVVRDLYKFIFLNFTIIFLLVKIFFFILIFADIYWELYDIFTLYKRFVVHEFFVYQCGLLLVV